MGRAVGGASAAGCGGLSFAGILVSIGLVVFLGARALDGVGDAGRTTTTTTTLAAGEDLPSFGDGSTFRLSSTEGLVDGSVIDVSVTDLPVGETVVVSMCLDALVGAGGTTACDPAMEASGVVGEDGTFQRDVTVARTIVVGTTRFDCAALAKGCSLLLHWPGEGSGITAPLTFDPDLPPVDAQPPPRP